MTKKPWLKLEKEIDFWEIKIIRCESSSMVPLCTANVVAPERHRGNQHSFRLRCSSIAKARFGESRSAVKNSNFATRQPCRTIALELCQVRIPNLRSQPLPASTCWAFNWQQGSYTSVNYFLQYYIVAVLFLWSVSCVLRCLSYTVPLLFAISRARLLESFIVLLPQSEEFPRVNCLDTQIVSQVALHEEKVLDLFENTPASGHVRAKWKHLLGQTSWQPLSGLVHSSKIQQALHLFRLFGTAWSSQTLANTWCSPRLRAFPVPWIYTPQTAENRWCPQESSQMSQ